MQLEALEARVVLSGGKKLVPDGFPLEALSSVPMFLAAQSLGITQIAGKDIRGSGSPPGNAQAKKLNDVGIGVDPVLHENEPTVAANPRDKNYLVAASHLATPGPGPVIVDYRIAIFRSEDGGATWSGPVLADRLPGAIASSDPVLAYTPDGSRVYLAYLDIKGDGDVTHSDVLVSHSDDNGATWSTPVIALRAQPGFFGYDKPWIDADNTHVYVTATKFSLSGSDSIALARSSNKGASFPNSAAPVLLDTVSFPRLVIGARPTVGPNGEVLVAWYDSGADGPWIGSFEINTARSGNFAASFDPAVVAVTDSFELPYWLGPFASYHRWWAGMTPDVEIDAKGDAHIVYTHDPVANPLTIPGIPGGVSTTPEDGDIRYITSRGPSFTTWSSPVTINDDASGTAQGYPALEIQNGDTLHVIWEDHRLSSTDNLSYDIFYSRKVPGQGVGWAQNFRVSDASSISDFIFTGDYIDLTSNSSLLFGVWTDRRHQSSIVAYEDNVFGSRIIAGGAAPNSASALASNIAFIPASPATAGAARFGDPALLHPGGMAEPFLAPGGSLGDLAAYFAATDFLSARGGSLRGVNLPIRLTDVLAGIVAPAGFSPWRRVTSDAASAATPDDDAPAALHAVRVDRIFKEVGEEYGLPWGKGSDRDEGLLNVTSDLWEPGREALVPLKL
ncbi:MAG TPA: sialidase family protein [Gemmataceae bacterium]|nr:sialidase family protein [Gemmataceae bacterium]